MIYIYFGVTIFLVLLDQLFKYLAYFYLQPVSSVEAIPYLLDLVYVENRGVAFGMFQDMQWLFITITSIVIVVFVVLLIKYYKKSRMFSVAATLIIAGGIGNLIDRVWHGFVIDYLQLSFFDPVCNFADYCITFGTVLLVVYLLFFSDKKEKTPKIKEEL